MSTVEERFWSKVNKNGPLFKGEPCWLWLMGTNDKGYGYFAVGRKMVRAPRFAYELLVGPIPDGLELDHLCRNRTCVNPAHLETVTSGENNRRGDVGKYNTIKTHCPQGHPYDLLNTYFYRGRRYCRACKYLSVRRFRACA